LLKIAATSLTAPAALPSRPALVIAQQVGLEFLHALAVGARGLGAGAHVLGLGTNGQLIIEVISEIESIMGKRQPVPKFRAIQSRFNHV